MKRLAMILAAVATLAALAYALVLAFTAEAPAEASAEPLPPGRTLGDPWARPGPLDGMSAAYFTLANGTAAPDTLLGAASAGAQGVELHETVDRGGGVRGMRRVERVPVAAQTQVAFQPGGLHVMLLNLTRELTPGDSLDLALYFRDDTLTVRLPVRSP